MKKIHVRKQLMKYCHAAAMSAVIAIGASAPQPAVAAVSVVTSIPEFAAITKEVGGAKVSVYSIAPPNRDYHRIEARPSDVQRVARARLIVETGMDLELWMTALMNAAGNKRLNRGGAGYVDASEGIKRLEIPTTQISGASGDIHVHGNPHFYYDPIYAKFIARNILKGLVRVDPSQAQHYRANYVRFNSRIDQGMVRWRGALAPYAGEGVVTYHKNYAYFLRRFGLRHFGTLEPKPGIPPSAGHVNALLQNMKRNKVRAIVIESIYPTRYADLMSRQLGVKYAVSPYSVGSPGTSDYFNFMDKMVGSFKAALSR